LPDATHAIDVEQKPATRSAEAVEIETQITIRAMTLGTGEVLADSQTHPYAK
jgi:hypothetical protein